MTRPWIAGAAALAFVAAFLAASVALGGGSDRKATDRSIDVRLSSVAELPTIAEDPALLAERMAARRERLRAERRRAAARRAAATEAAAPAVPEEIPVEQGAPEPVEPPPAVVAPAPAAPPPPPPETFDDSG